MGNDASKSCSCSLAASKDAATIAVDEMKPRPILKTRLPKVPQDSSGPDSGDRKQVCQVVRFSQAACPERLSPTTLRVCAKMRHVLLGAVAHLRLFRSFLKPLYSTPKEAFVALASDSDDGTLTRLQFIAIVQRLGFAGRAEWVFETLRDGSGRISRKSFAKGMCAAGTKQWAPERLNFLVMVTAAQSMAHYTQSGSAKSLRSSERDLGTASLSVHPSPSPRLSDRRSFTPAEAETDVAGAERLGSKDTGGVAKKRRKSDSSRRRSV